MFRRRKRADQTDPTDPTDTSAASQTGGPADPTDQAEADAASTPSRPQGPWDVSDVADPDTGRIDLGGLFVPVPPDTEVRVDVSPEGEVIAATLVQGQAQVQVNAFAAPRTEGIWPEVCEEIQASLVEAGGQAEQRPGPFGLELQALVPTEVPGQGVAMAPVRFVGVDGPRWFLRALFSGAAAVQREAAEPLEAALREVVVVRGGDPMAVRDPLPLRLPPEVAEQQAAAQQQATEGVAQEPDAPRLAMPERGPEITETR